MAWSKAEEVEHARESHGRLLPEGPGSDELQIFAIEEWERAWWPQNRDRVEAGSRWLRNQSVAPL